MSKNVWIEINGHKITCVKLLDALYSGGKWLPGASSFDERWDYDEKRRIIEDYINDYRGGSKEISDDLRRHYKAGDLPEIMQYPEAIVEMLLRLEQRTGLNLAALLESAEKDSIEEVKNIKEERERHRSLNKIAKKAAERISSTFKWRR